MSNPLLEELKSSLTQQTLTVSLPTLGRWYPPGVLDEGVDPSEIDVSVLGVMAEQNFRDPWLVASGKGIPSLIRYVAPQILKPELLTEVDLEAILITSRIVSYGPDLEFSHTCEQMIEVADDEGKSDQENEKEKKTEICGEENKLNIDLQKFIMKYAPINDDEMNQFIVNFENYGQIVHLRPINYISIMELMKKSLQSQKTFKEWSKNITENTVEDFVLSNELIEAYSKITTINTERDLITILANIHGVESIRLKQILYDQNQIRDWLLALPLEDVREIAKKTSAINSRFTKLSEISYTCGKCGKENSISITLDYQKLFTPAGDSQMPKKPSHTLTGRGKRGKQLSKTLQR
jgi:hypothetical protein